mmetsp:Transcript_16090/g.31525  ORF Transcript_16090/g.31525 Transcript_16090/m.31525 type:complete len:96 (-) Transcript_16090:665-952(-)
MSFCFPNPKTEATTMPTHTSSDVKETPLPARIANTTTISIPHTFVDSLNTVEAAATAGAWLGEEGVPELRAAVARLEAEVCAAREVVASEATDKG